MRDLLEKVISADISKKINTLASSLLKKFSFNDKNDLEKLNELGFWLYIKGHASLSLEVCKIINNEKFKNNFELWSWIELLLGFRNPYFKRETR